jgi:uncharacterized protein YndB with AHSA1/START domain
MVSAATSTVIHAPAERIWEVLADLDTYPDWNPIFAQVRGELRGGERLALTLAGDRPDGAPRTVSAIVLEVRRHRSFRWLLTPSTPEGSGAIDFPAAVVYAVDLKAARAGGTIVRERLTGLGSSVAWLGDRAMLTRWLEASTGALWDRMHNVPADRSADRPIAGTIRLVSRYRCHAHAARLAGLRTAVGDLMVAWPRSAAA